jgi:hypothetical protein
MRVSLAFETPSFLFLENLFSDAVVQFYFRNYADYSILKDTFARL